MPAPLIAKKDGRNNNIWCKGTTYYQHTSTGETRKLLLPTPIHQDIQNKMATETSQHELQQKYRNAGYLKHQDHQ